MAPLPFQESLEALNEAVMMPINMSSVGSLSQVVLGANQFKHQITNSTIKK